MSIPLLLAQAAGGSRIERRLEFASLPEGWGAVLAATTLGAVLWGVVWMYRHEGRVGASMRWRMFLATVRCLALLCLATIWFQPILATYIHRFMDAYTLVLVDTSSSMALLDHYRQGAQAEPVSKLLPGAADSGGVVSARRIDLARQVLTSDNGRWLARLADRNSVKLFSFSNTADELASIPATRTEGESPAEPREPLGFELNAAGTETDLGHSLRRAVDGIGASPLAGVVVLTDGCVNSGESLDVVGQFAKAKRIPLSVVGVGDPSPPRNIRVTDVSAPNSVFITDPFDITVHLASRGMEGESVQVELIERPVEGGDGQSPGNSSSKTVVLGGEGGLVAVSFRATPRKPGRVVYEARVPVAPYESVEDDNAKQTTVSVIDNKMRVLLVSGGPSWQYRFLTRLLERDDTFNVSCWLQSAAADAVRDGNTVIDHLPFEPQELFAYDVIVLLDPDPSEMTLDWAQSVERLVSEYGGGLLYAAARKNTSRFMRFPDARPIVELLPVSLDPEAELVINQLGHYQLKDTSPVPAPDAVDNPILAMADDPAESRRIWDRLGGVFWHYPVQRTKPAAVGLLQHADPRMRNNHGSHVLLAVQLAGTGRTGFLAFDGTWRWRAVGEQYFNRFWVQLLRYLVEGKLLGGQKRGLLLTDNESYPFGQSVSVSARLLDKNYEPLNLEQVQVSFASETGHSGAFTLARQMGRSGWYQGQFVAPAVGAYRLTLRLPATADGEAVEVTRELQMTLPNAEIQETRMQRDKLQDLARQSDGGQYYDIHEASVIPDQIEDRHESTITKGRPILLWDNGYVLVALVILLTVEWAGRRLSRLL